MVVFDIKQFEQFFKERTLKNGLKLFEKSELELLERSPGFGYHFSVSNANLHLKKKGDKLLSYSCNCGSNLYCEHLAAAMFYFQQEALGLSARNKTAVKQKKGGKAGWKKTTDDNLRKTETESLYKFVKEHGNELTHTSIDFFLVGKTSIRLFDVYCMQFKFLFETYLHLKKLDQPAIDELETKITVLIRRTKKEGKNKETSFSLYLAFVREFIPVFNARFTGNEKQLLDSYYNALKKLDASFTRGLSLKQKQEWWLVTLSSLETNKSLSGETFMFMIPRFLSFAKTESELLVLHTLLKRRAYKIPYTQRFDKLLITRLEVALREWKLFKTALPLHQKGGEVELIVAKAELDFYSGKDQKAFNLLELHYESVRTEHKSYYNDYLAYIISNAGRCNKEDLELKYLREGFMYGLFIQPENLDRYLQLVPLSDHAVEIEKLVYLIRSKRQYYSFDKLVTLLTKGKRYDALIEAIRLEGNRFNLLHWTMLAKFPEYTEKQLDLYIKQLMDAYAEKRIYHYQEQLFDQSKDYLNKLPVSLKQKLVKKILEKLGGQSKIYEYIVRLYDFEFLEEEKK